MESLLDGLRTSRWSVVLGRQDLLLGQEDILLGQQDILLGQQDMLLGQQDFFLGQQDILLYLVRTEPRTVRPVRQFCRACFIASACRATP